MTKLEVRRCRHVSTQHGRRCFTACVSLFHSVSCFCRLLHHLVLHHEPKSLSSFLSSFSFSSFSLLLLFLRGVIQDETTLARTEDALDTRRAAVRGSHHHGSLHEKQETSSTNPCLLSTTAASIRCVCVFPSLTHNCCAPVAATPFCLSLLLSSSSSSSSLRLLLIFSLLFLFSLLYPEWRALACRPVRPRAQVENTV